jgi:hypothetical protein
MQPQGDHVDDVLGSGDIATVDGYPGRPERATVVRIDDAAAQCACYRVALVVGLQTGGVDGERASGRPGSAHRQLAVQAAREETGPQVRA